MEEDGTLINEPPIGSLPCEVCHAEVDSLYGIYISIGDECRWSISACNLCSDKIKASLRPQVERWKARRLIYAE